MAGPARHQRAIDSGRPTGAGWTTRRGCLLTPRPRMGTRVPMRREEGKQAMTRPIAEPGAVDAPGPTPAPRRIVAILRHPLMLNGVRAVISGHDGIEVVGTAASLAEGRRLIAAVRHDIVIADLDLPDGSALGIVDARRDGVRTILLSEDPTRPALEDALARGARGFIAATLRGPSLIDAIRIVAGGGVALEPGLDDPRQAGSRWGLAPQQRAIVTLVCDGHSNDEIAVALAISAKTVETHLSRLYQRHHLQGRIELMRHALAVGWIGTPSIVQRSAGPSV